MFPVQLATDRLTLREYEVADATVRFEYFSDPRVTKYQTLVPMPTLESAVERVRANFEHAQQAERREYVFAITSDGKVLGECGLLLSDEKDRCAHVFYTLAHEAWGNGFASEAAVATVRFGFESLGLHRIVATAHPDNLASVAIATQKLGMLYEGTHRDYEMGMHGEFLDMNTYATLATDQHPWDD